MRKAAINYVYTLGYQVLLMILPIITLPYVSRVLLPSGVGINSWTSAISSYFVLFAVLGLTTYGQREIAINKKNSEKLSETFWQIEIASTVTTIISMAAYLITVLLIGKYQLYLAIYALSIIASMLDVSWFLAGIEEFSILTRRNFIVKIISVALIFVLVKKGSDLPIYIAIQSGTVLLANLSLWPIIIKLNGWPKSVKWLGVQKQIRQSLIYFVPQISISLYATLNKVVLGGLSGTTQTGYFDSSDKIVRLLFTILASVTTVMMPRISSMFSEKRNSEIEILISKILKASLWIVLPLTFGVIVNSEFIINLLLGSQFNPAISILQISSLVLIPMAIANVLGGQVLIPMNMVKFYTISVIGGALVNLIIDVPLIILGSSKGAAIASLASEIVVTCIQIYFCRKIISFKNLMRSGGLSVISRACLCFVPVLILVHFGVVVNDLIILMVSVIVVILYGVMTKSQLMQILKK